MCQYMLTQFYTQKLMQCVSENGSILNFNKLHSDSRRKHTDMLQCKRQTIIRAPHFQDMKARDKQGKQERSTRRETQGLTTDLCQDISNKLN